MSEQHRDHPRDHGPRRVGQVKEITSLANPIIKDIKALAQKKTRDETHTFMADLDFTLSAPTGVTSNVIGLVTDIGNTTTGGAETAMNLTIDDLKFYDRQMKWTYEPGAFKVMVGPDSVNVKSADFTLINGKGAKPAGELAKAN